MRLVILTITIFASCTMQLAGASIKEITQNADAIVVGSVEERVEGAADVSFSVSVERTVSGDAVPAIISVVHQWSPKRRGLVFDPGGHTSKESVRGVWFLKRGTTTWDVIAVTFPDITFYGLFYPAATIPRASYKSAESGSTLDAVLTELFSGVDATGNDPNTLISSLDDEHSSVVSVALAHFVASPNLLFHAAGIVGQLRLSEAVALQNIMTMGEDLSKVKDSSSIATALRDSFRSSDPSSTRALIRLASQPTLGWLRGASVNALAASHANESLPFLAALLDSDDQDERMKGVFGLSAFANGCPPQTRANVKSLDYIVLPASAKYQTPETIAHFAFRRGDLEQEAGLIMYWHGWWMEHPELHMPAGD